ncbi:MAG TPA: hypothetical protein VEF35_00530 [Candidatus Bathyarchaeia archaeon]|nr:hypothetical protein [Candidatus Bathyarchaeia archaeon]
MKLFISKDRAVQDKERATGAIVVKVICYEAGNIEEWVWRHHQTPSAQGERAFVPTIQAP